MQLSDLVGASNVMVVGIDPSLTGLGISAGQFLTGLGISKGQVTEVFRTSASLNYTLRERCSLLAFRIDLFLTRHLRRDVPRLVAIEAPAFYASSGKTNLYDRGYLRCSLDSVFYNHNCLVIDVAPTTLRKFVCGRGNAPKMEVPVKVLKRWGVDFEDDAGANKAEAYALYQYGAAVIKGEIEYVPPLQRGKKR